MEHVKLHVLNGTEQFKMLSSPISSLLILQWLYIWAFWLKEHCTAQNHGTGLISSDFHCDGPECCSLKATEKYRITALFGNFTTFPIPEQEKQYSNSVRWQNFTMGKEPAKQLKIVSYEKPPRLRIPKNDAPPPKKKKKKTNPKKKKHQKKKIYYI